MKHWKRTGKMSHHHIKAKVNGGQKIPENILLFDVDRHRAYHYLFGNMSFREVATLLLRVCEMKGQRD